MAKVLMVRANDRPSDQAVSVKMYQTFVESYRKAHPEDEIVELDLFAEKEQLPYYSAEAIHAITKKGQGLELTEKEQQLNKLIEAKLDQFLSVNKVVFAFPLWNFTVPAVLHTYIDYLAYPGKTFRYEQEGPVGLLTDKKVALLVARGGVYSEGPAVDAEMAARYMQVLMRFFGIQDITEVVIEGHNAFPDRAEEIVQEGLERVAKAAQEF
jgi:FMN-dependent NADH-azoreductase